LRKQGESFDKSSNRPKSQGNDGSRLHSRQKMAMEKLALPREAVVKEDNLSRNSGAPSILKYLRS